jgi:hypothetical protein
MLKRHLCKDVEELLLIERALKIMIVVALSPILVSLADASQGRCLLEVGGHVYLSGRCNIESWAGGFSIGTGESTRAKYFAYVNIDPAGKAEGYWNGPNGEDHASYELPGLDRDGGCWSNDHAKVCAWK